MRTLSALLFLLLLCSLQLTSSAPQAPNIIQCCDKVTVTKIPLKKVVSYRRTHSECPFKAIIFETVAGKQLCVDPDAVWVSGHVAAVEKRNNTKAETITTTPTLPSA